MQAKYCATARKGDIVKSLLITGHKGYIGKHLCASIKANIDGVDAKDGRDIQSGGAAMPYGPHDAVIHLAAIASVPASWHLPLRTWGVNALGTQALLSSLACRGYKGRVIFASTLLAAQPESSPYAGSKLACESMIRHAARKYGFTAVILRLANVAGGEDRTPGRLLVEMQHAAHLGQDFQIRTGYATPDSSPVRDFVHVADVVEAFKESLEVPLKPGHTICVDIGTGIGTSCLQMLALFEQYSGRTLGRITAPAHPGDVAVSIADPEPAACLLGWRATRVAGDIVREVAGGVM